MKPEKNEDSVFKTFVDTDEVKKIAEIVVKNYRAEQKIEDCANLLVEAKEIHNRHNVDSLMYGGMAMYEVVRSSFISLVCQILIESAYAIEEADNAETVKKENERKIEEEQEVAKFNKFLRRKLDEVGNGLDKVIEDILKSKSIPKSVIDKLEDVRKVICTTL